ncbi:hypothetical protein GOBAR_DD07514 [Gossypium barbadense]|nr:hypothetical protein GOBAR_DD07514 [Gossypium barbadense]
MTVGSVILEGGSSGPPKTLIFKQDEPEKLTAGALRSPEAIVPACFQKGRPWMSTAFDEEKGKRRANRRILPFFEVIPMIAID